MLTAFCVLLSSLAASPALMGRSSLQEPIAPTEVLIHGRFLLEDGAPAVGAAIEVEGWRASSERVLQFGLPDSWTEPSAVTDSEGRFRLTFDAPRAYQFTLTAHLTGYAPAYWRWLDLEPGLALDLGDIELETGATVRVRINDSDGTPTSEAWEVYVKPVDWDEHARQLARRTGTPTSNAGEWIVTDVPSGRMKVAAYSAIANWIESPAMQIRPGDDLSRELVYSGPDNSKRIVVNAFSGLIYPIEPTPKNVRIEGGGLAEPLRCERKVGSQSYDFPDLPPGDYTVVIDDPLFERWERRGVQPGGHVNASLEGSAAVRVSLLDAESGVEIPDGNAKVRVEGVNFIPNEFPLDADPNPLSGSRFALPPGNYTLKANAEGFAEYEVSVEGLKRGEERLVVAELGRPRTLRGTVRWSNDRPASGATVKVYYPGVLPITDENWWRAWGSEQRDRHRLGESTTDSAGSFTLEVPPSDRWIVRAVAAPGVHVVRELAPSKSGEVPEALLRLPPTRTVQGRVTGATPGSRIVVRAAPIDGVGNTGLQVWYPDWDAFLETELDPTGSFSLGPLPTTPLRVAVLSGHPKKDADIRTLVIQPVSSGAGPTTRVTIDLEREQSR